jgi:hypothetical protein
MEKDQVPSFSFKSFTSECSGRFPPMIYTVSLSEILENPQPEFPHGILESETTGNYLIPLNTSLSIVEGNYTGFIIAQQAE